MLKIDEETGSRVRTALLRADARGADPVRALDELGLLQYPARQRATMASTLHEAADLLEQLTPRQLAGEDRLATASLDTKRHITLWLRESARKLEAS
jgi:hypothetical protein